MVGTGTFEREIAGQEQHQSVLEAMCGPRRPQGVNRFETAWLIPDDGNPLDPNAVRVEIGRIRVGYLNDEDAAQYRQYVKARGRPSSAEAGSALTEEKAPTR